MIGIDFEYIKENAPEGDDPGGRPDIQNTYCEIVQIGACKIDADGKEIKSLNIMVAPYTIQTLPPWFVSMTGITEKKRESGIPFPDALKQLQTFVGEESLVVTFSGDWFVLEGNVKKWNIANPFPEPFVRLKPMLDTYGIGLEDFKRSGLQEVQSGGLYKVLNITLPKTSGVGEHDAEHDARSLIHSAYHLGIR
jgi:DNA polymerase III alpha subunit (gram-positive type)